MQGSRGAEGGGGQSPSHPSLPVTGRLPYGLGWDDIFLPCLWPPSSIGEVPHGSQLPLPTLWMRRGVALVCGHMSESGFLHLGTSQAVCGQAVSPGQVFQECTLARLAVGARLCFLGHPLIMGRSLVVFPRVWCVLASLQFFFFFFFGRAGCSSSLKIPIHPSSTGIQACATLPGFLCGCWDLILCPNALVVNTLLNKLPAQPPADPLSSHIRTSLSSH